MFNNIINMPLAQYILIKKFVVDLLFYYIYILIIMFSITTLKSLIYNLGGNTSFLIFCYCRHTIMAPSTALILHRGCVVYCLCIEETVIFIFCLQHAMDKKINQDHDKSMTNIHWWRIQHWNYFYFQQVFKL